MNKETQEMNKGNLIIYYNEIIVHGYSYAKAYNFAVEKDGEIINFDTRFADDVNGFKARIKRYNKGFELTFKQRSPMEIKALCQRHKEYLHKTCDCFYGKAPEPLETTTLDDRYQFAFMYRGR